MKTITIYHRNVIPTITYRRYRCKDGEQYVVEYDGKQYRNGHSVEIDDPKIRIPFRVVLETRSEKDVGSFLKKLGRSKADKWLSALILDLMDR